MKKKRDFSYQASPLKEYVYKALSSEIVVGAELKQMLRIIDEDIENSVSVYDGRKPELLISGIESLCVQTKSPYTGQPFKLELFQKAFICAIFGVKNLDGTDRFQRVLFLVARKNGKSALISSLILVLFLLFGKGADYLCASNDDNQTDIVFNELDIMRRLVDQGDTTTYRQRDKLINTFNDNKVFKMTFNQRAKDGRNPDIAVVDEVHEMPDDRLNNAIEQGQSVKDNPKLIMLTTAGITNGFLDRELEKARGVLSREVADPTYLAWLYTQDSEEEIWQDETSWQKSNPMLSAKIKKMSYMRKMVAEAKRSVQSRTTVLTKDFNIKQSSAQKWLSLEDLELILPSKNPLDSLREKQLVCVGGVDLAKTTDLVSASLIHIDTVTGVLNQLTHCWISSAKLEQYPDKKEGAHYIDWHNEEFLTIVQDDIVNSTLVADWFAKQFRDYKLMPFKIGYDIWGSDEFLNRCKEYGLETEKVSQTKERLTSPINLLEAKIKNSQFKNNSPVVRWCLENTMLEQSTNGLLKPAKASAGEKIDATASLLTALATYIRNKDELTKIWTRQA